MAHAKTKKKVIKNIVLGFEPMKCSTSVKCYGYHTTVTIATAQFY